MSEIHQWYVPSRLTVLGEHLLDVGGPALIMPIDRGALVKARRRADAEIHVWAWGKHAVFRPGDLPRDGWRSSVAQVLGELVGAGVSLVGADVVLDTPLRWGSGLGVETAFATGLVRALTDLAGAGERADALLAARGWAELEPAIHLLEADGPGRTIEVGWREARLSLVVIDTGVHHPIASAELAARADECAGAAEAAGVEKLATIDLAGLVSLSDPTWKSRAQHVLTETARVRGAAKALDRGEWEQFGAMLTASHVSLRDDFAVSCAELDTAVEVAIGAGALGARLVGPGFGGSVIALVPVDSMLGLREKILAAFESRQWPTPTLFSTHP